MFYRLISLRVWTRAFCFFSIVSFGIVPSETHAQSEWPIPNTLNLNWPGDLVYFESEGAPDRNANGIEIDGVVTPIQIEEVDGKTRYWSYVKVPKREKDEPPLVARLFYDRVDPGIDLGKDGDCYLVDNGTYQFRLRYFDGELDKPMPLSDLPHWIGGMRTLEQEDWDGRAWFESNETVVAAKTELLARGPVFIDFKVTLEFENGATGETVDALPLASGKQSHLWESNQFPAEEVTKLSRHYEVLVRFVMDDPWIDVNERFHFPRDPDSEPWGITQYWLQWGHPEGAAEVRGLSPDEHMKVDTVTWVRWFLYDKFGGNTSQQTVAAEPRDDQKGRPFALLRPRWNQGGGGAQDFVVTHGGGPAPSLHWLTYAYLKNPVRELEKNGSEEEKKQVKSLYKTLRSKSFSDEERMAAAIEIGEMVGKKVRRPSEDYSERNPAVGLVAAFASKWVGPYPATIATYALDNNRARARFPLIDGERSGKHYGQRAYGLLVGPRGEFSNLNNLVRRHTDWTLVAEQNKYILDWERGGEVKHVNKLPTGHLFIERRYQDDFLNPTQRATRDLVQLGEARRAVGEGVPIGGPWQAALGYIFSDPDHWPGWHNGWSPGNPNFHTDKYMGTVYTASALPEHPHAKEWLEYGWQNLKDDLDKAIVGSDGVGAECPGYSGYSLMHQLDIMRTLRDNGLVDVLERGAAVKKSGTWHRKLITPYDYRIGLRHEAPIGDTHRWTSGLSGGFGKLAYLYQQADPAFAAEMLGTYKLLKASGDDSKYMKLDDWLGNATLDVQAADPKGMEWGSQSFEGFGAILRNNFGTDEESFLSMKAGSTGGHYHNDDMAFHFYSEGDPISLDYNCSYAPRGDHAALHNSMTFGKEGTVRHNADERNVEAMEQIYSRAKVLAFETSPKVDLVVAERSSEGLGMSPLFPEDHEFNRDYSWRKVDTIRHRRTLLFVKPEAAGGSDYLVVRDETDSTEPQQLNLHLLARELDIDGDRVEAKGQWDRDMSVAFFAADGSGDLRIEERAWWYVDSWLKSPGEPYVLRPGESQAEWAARMAQLDAVPAAGWQPAYREGKDDRSNQAWLNLVKETDGQALMPPPGWRKDAGWKYGEYQKWLRVHTAPGEDVIWVLYPRKVGEAYPDIKYNAKSGQLTVKHAGGTDQFDFSDGVTAEVDGEEVELLEADVGIPEMGRATTIDNSSMSGFDRQEELDTVTKLDFEPEQSNSLGAVPVMMGCVVLVGAGIFVIKVRSRNRSS